MGPTRKSSCIFSKNPAGDSLLAPWVKNYWNRWTISFTLQSEEQLRLWKDILYSEQAHSNLWNIGMLRWGQCHHDKTGEYSWPKETKPYPGSQLFFSFQQKTAFIAIGGNYLFPREYRDKSLSEQGQMEGTSLQPVSVILPINRNGKRYHCNKSHPLS